MPKVEEHDPIHTAQALTSLRLTEHDRALVVNVDEAQLVDDFRRFVDT